MKKKKLDNNWITFEKYFDLFKYKDNNIDFKKVLAFDILKCVYDSNDIESKNFKGLTYPIIKTIDFTDIELALEHQNLLVTNRTKRNDYLELFNHVLKGINNHSFIEISDLPQKTKFSILTFVTSIYYCLPFIYNGFSFKKTFFLTSKLYSYRLINKSLIKILKNNKDIKTGKYLCFNSSVGIENLFCQVFNNFKLDTYSISHGVNFGEFAKFKPLDYINGYNISAKKIFVWGEFSNDDLVKNFKIKEKNILIAGNPKYPKKEINIKNSFKNCIVILPRDLYDKPNQDLLEEIYDLKLKLKCNVSIKTHPSLDFKKYSGLASKYKFKIIGLNTTLKDCLSSGEFDFSIGYNTNAYYESLYFNMIFLRYQKYENELFVGLNDKFNNSEELFNKIIEFKNTKTTQLNNEGKKILIKSLGLGINKYSQFLN